MGGWSRWEAELEWWAMRWEGPVEGVCSDEPEAEDTLLPAIGHARVVIIAHICNMLNESTRMQKRMTV